MTILENHNLQLNIDPTQACWHLASVDRSSPELQSANSQVVYYCNGRRYQALRSWQPYELTTPHFCDSVHGHLQQVVVHSGPDACGLHARLFFALAADSPMLLWRIQIDNQGLHPVFLERIDLLHLKSIPHHSGHTVSKVAGLKAPLAFFSNGWGSWNYTGVYGQKDRFRRTRLGVFTSPMRVNAGTPQPYQRGQFASDMFGVLGSRSQRQAVLAGFLSQQQHFGSLQAWTNPQSPRLHLWANGDGARLDPGQQTTTDWACLYFLNLDDPDPLQPYYQAVAREHGLNDAQQDFLLPSMGNHQPGNGRFSGWCSWYHYYGNVTAQDVRNNLQAAQGLQLPFDLIQIDDGFQACVGDWFTFNNSFPGGVAPLAQEIQASGATPGLWLAPYIVHPNSHLYRSHPEWLIRGRFNRPVNAGFSSWGTFTTALDLTHPDALEHTQQVIYTAAHKWGFPYLKLDFLYAAALPGHRHDPTRTRAQILRTGLAALREAAGPDVTLVGCGCPLGPAIGLVDAMRIGADVAPHWPPNLKGIEYLIRKEPDYPSVRNAIQNSLTRAGMHRRWWINDPDCLLLRPETALSLAEVQALATVIALSGGPLLLSDDLSTLPPERLRIAASLLPVTGLRPQVLDWFDSATPQRLRLDLENSTGSWSLLALFNWQELTQEMSLRLRDFGVDPNGGYYAHEFWSNRQAVIQAGEIYFPNVPSHGVRLVALRHWPQDVPCFLGSDLHVSQGLEISAWQDHPGKLSLQLDRPGQAQGSIVLGLPAPPRLALLNNSPCSWKAEAPGRYRLYLEFDRQARLEIHY